MAKRLQKPKTPGPNTPAKKRPGPKPDKQYAQRPGLLRDLSKRVKSIKTTPQKVDKYFITQRISTLCNEIKEVNSMLSKGNLSASDVKSLNTMLIILEASKKTFEKALPSMK